MAITLLKIKALPKRINHKKWVEIQYSCLECGGVGTVRVTDGQWSEMIDNPIPSYLCANCGGWVRSGSEELHQQNPDVDSFRFTFPIRGKRKAVKTPRPTPLMPISVLQN
jgi:DNA-directed RNA polymerase subunit RPC12/RpoP